MGPTTPTIFAVCSPKSLIIHFATYILWNQFQVVREPAVSHKEAIRGGFSLFHIRIFRAEYSMAEQVEQLLVLRDLTVIVVGITPSR